MPDAGVPRGSSPSASTELVAVVAQLRAAGCVFAEDEARLIGQAALDQAELDRIVARRVAGWPLEHAIGWAEFRGLRIVVEPGVFVPRVRSEFLIEQAAALTPAGAIVVDLCCGSGALGLALAAAVPVADLHAVDIDPAAVACTSANLASARASARVPATGTAYLGDLYEPLPATLRRRIDTVIANVPYVPSGEVALLPAEARLHEARVALDGGTDGLDVLRRVAAGAPAWLKPGGHLLIETSERQAGLAAQAFAQHGLEPRISDSADVGVAVVIGSRIWTVTDDVDESL